MTVPPRQKCGPDHLNSWIDTHRDGTHIEGYIYIYIINTHTHIYIYIYKWYIWCIYIYIHIHSIFQNPGAMSQSPCLAFYRVWDLISSQLKGHWDDPYVRVLVSLPILQPYIKRYYYSCIHIIVIEWCILCIYIYIYIIIYIMEFGAIVWYGHLMSFGCGDGEYPTSHTPHHCRHRGPMVSMGL